MLQSKKADDYVISTGIHSDVRTFVEKCCRYIGVKLKWKGTGMNEKGFVEGVNRSKAPKIKVNQVIIKVDKRYYRPSEVNELLGDSTKARKKLGWKPKIKLDELILEMMESDINKMKKTL